MCNCFVANADISLFKNNVKFTKEEFMQSFFNLFTLIGKLPKILLFLAAAYLIIKVLRAFTRDCIVNRENSFWVSICNFLDPYRQSIFFYKHKLIAVVLLAGITYLLYRIYVPPEYLSYEKGMYPAQSVMYNHITYFISYLIHENLGHNVFCTFGQNWFCYFSGDFMQVFVPCIIYLFSLQVRGGLFFSPILFYWISSALYDAGIYASDAAVSQLALTMSDMVSDAAAGTVKGDWHYILTPFNAVNYGATIGLILEIAACFIFALALYSVIEYIRRMMQDGLEDC